MLLLVLLNLNIERFCVRRWFTSLRGTNTGVDEIFYRKNLSLAALDLCILLCCHHHVSVALTPTGDHGLKR